MEYGERRNKRDTRDTRDNRRILTSTPRGVLLMFNAMTAVFRTRGMASPRRANQETTAAGTRRCSAAGDVAQTLQPASGVVNNDVEVLLQLGPAVESSSQPMLHSCSRMIDSCPSIAIIQLAHLYHNGPFLIQVYRLLYRKRDAIVSDCSSPYRPLPTPYFSQHTGWCYLNILRITDHKVR
ncbi:hypothetical protein CI102_11364 [Trichoderma harzianum]|nr:hypothetical protein CI102_11364 [Trichoderma harzianum]